MSEDTLPVENAALNAMIEGGPMDAAETRSVVRLVMRVTLVVPTLEDPTLPGARLRPVVVRSGELDCVVAFTSGEAALRIGDRAPFVVTMPGQMLVRGLADGVGVIVDTGKAAMVMSPGVLNADRE